MKNELVLFLLVGAVFLSGCIGQGGPSGGSAGNGVIIQSFSPDLSSIEGGGEVGLTLTIKNIGGMDAIDLQASLLGINWVGSSNTQTLERLSKADPTTGAQGEDYTFDWSVTTPESKSSDITYDIGARVTYSYSTVSETQLRIATRAYYKTITQPGSKQTKIFGIVKTMTTSGPFAVTVSSRVPYVESGDKPFRVQFVLQNAGSGRTYADDIATNLDKVKKINVTLDTEDITDSCFQSGTNANVKLSGGKGKTFYCDISVPGITNYIEKVITVNITYDYFVDSTTSVTVLKA